MAMFFVLLFYVLQVNFAKDVYVDLKNGSGNSSCWTGGRANGCNSLALALEGLQHYNHSTLWLGPGKYSLPQKPESTSTFKFMWMKNISIRNEPPYGMLEQPVIECRENSGFSFVNVDDVTIRGIKLIGCGTNQNTTSQLPNNSTQFMESKFAVYFLFCSNVTLESVTVQGSAGTGVVMYGTVGNVEIDNCNFVSNVVGEDDFGGGGLYIEFPYCAPGILNNDYHCYNSSNVPPEFVSNGKYRITKCRFSNNVARTPNAEDNTFILPHHETHIAFGRGGGLSVFFKGVSVGNDIQVSQCTFINNTALWGGGLFVEYQDSSSLNSFFIENSTFLGNEVFHKSDPIKGTGGGGARIGYISFDVPEASFNSLKFMNISFENNRAYFGGGLSFYTSKENRYSPSNALEFQNCEWKNNVARVGSAVDLALWHASQYGVSVLVNFTNCNFSQNSASYSEAMTEAYTVGVGALYSDSIEVHFAEFVLFNSNTHSALACIGAQIVICSGCEVSFFNNSGRHGGAIALLGLAYIVVFSETVLQFIGNSASVKGGAIFGECIGEHDLISSRNCFIRYYDQEVTPSQWKSKFIFINNTANSKTNSIFATSLLPCLWGGAFGSAKDAVNEVFCWNDYINPNRWIYGTNCSNEISTSPSTFQFSSNSSGVSDGYVHVFPGIYEQLPIFMFDDRDHNVTDLTVMTANMSYKTDPMANVDKSSLYISDNAVKLHGLPNSTAKVTLETIDPRVISYHFRVKFSDCPRGMVLGTTGNVSACVCLDRSMYGSLVRCDYKQSLLLRAAWFGKVTMNDSIEYVAALSPYTAPLTSKNWYPLHQDYQYIDMCRFLNRTGALCSRCIKNNGPVINRIYSTKCRYCPPKVAQYHWIVFILTEYFPTFIFFLIVVLFNISVTSGPANSFVFFAQILTTVYEIDGDGVIQLQQITHYSSYTLKAIYTVPYDIWNLRFFQPLLPELCISPSILPLQVIMLGYVTAFFPLLLVMLFSFFVWAYGKGIGPVVCLCRPLHKLSSRFKRMWNLQDSITHALATFILVSYSRFSLESFLLLAFVPLYKSDSSVSYNVLYYDGTIHYLSRAHFPYLAASILVLLTFVAIPPILLMTPSIILLIKKIGKKFDPSFQIYSFLEPGPLLNQFLNSFHGCYKDGTGGEHGSVDYRWFAGLYFLFRVAIYLVFAFAPNWFLQYVVQQIVCIIALLTFVILKPYRNNIFNLVDASILAIMAVISTLSMYNYYLTKLNETLSTWAFVVQYILIFAPLLYISVYSFISLKKKLHRYQLCPCKARNTLDEMIGLLNNDDDILDISDRKCEIYSTNMDRSNKSPSVKSNTGSNKSNSYDSQDTDQSAEVTGTSNYGATA